MKKTLALNLVILGTVVLGARLQIAAIPYALIAWICAFVILVAFNRINSKYYPIYIFGIALGLLWQTSLLGAGVVGADIQKEYYVANLSLKSGIALAANDSQYGASIVVTVIAPFLSRALHIDLIWIFKAIFPICLAGVPVIMYLVFKRLFGDRRALWATIFFIFVPVMSLDIIVIAKAMVAELFFALVILVMISNMRQFHKGILLPILVILALFCHYTVGFILLFFIVSCLGLSSLIKLLRKDIWFGFKRNVSILVLALTVIISGSVGYIYLQNVDKGELINTVRSAIVVYTTRIVQYADLLSHKPPNTYPVSTMPTSDTSIKTETNIPIMPEATTSIIPETIIPITTPTNATHSFYVNNQAQLVRAGIGLDFLSATAWGKVFRIIQYATQLLIVLGLIQLWRKRREYNIPLEFMAFIIGGFILLACCIFVPLFSDMLNMTRFYHMALFFLAPLFVLGCELISRRAWFMSGLLLVYFVFTSGSIYEMTKDRITDRVDIPYSYVLSYERTGIIGVYSQDDTNCAKWLAYNSDQSLRIVCDMNTVRLLSEYMDINKEARIRVYQQSVGYYVPFTILSPPDGKYYIFLDTWNIKHGELVYNYDLGYTAGLRSIMAIPDSCYDLPIIYKSGEAVILLGGG